MTTENSKKGKKQDFVIDEEMKNHNIPNESLKPIEPQTDLVSMIQKFKDILNSKDSDWTLQISVINYLRRMLKFEKSTFTQFFYGIKFYPKIIELINSVRSSLAKNVLILLNEIFSEPMPSQEDKSSTNSLISLIKFTIPHLISKINSNQTFIKADSIACLESLIKNMKYFEVLLTFLELMNTKKAKDSELCADLSMKMIESLGKEFLVENNQFAELIKCVVVFYEAQRITNLKRCKSILDCFVKVMGQEEFNKKIEKCTKKEKENVKNIREAKEVEIKKKISTGTVSSLHFRQDIQQRKKSFRLSKINENKGNKSATFKIIKKGKESIAPTSKAMKLNDENAQKNY